MDDVHITAEGDTFDLLALSIMTMKSKQAQSWLQIRSITAHWYLRQV